VVWTEAVGTEQLTDEQVDEFLAGSDPNVAAMTRAVRVKLLEVFPDAIETAEGGELGLGFDRGYTGLVFTVSPQRGYVNIGVARGAALDDPAGLMEGRGRVHRHVKIRDAEQLDDTDLDDLLHRAVAARRADVAS
jgi:hypothetical protein